MKFIEDLVREVKGDGKSAGKKVDELALGYLRYEAIRKLNDTQFARLHCRNVLGENFDKMVDEMVLIDNFRKTI